MLESDSSEEDIAEKLRLSEAVVNVTHQNVTEHTLCNGKGIKISEGKQLKRGKEIIKPSLRPSAEEKEEEDATFTQGVKSFVAKKLSEQLDRMIDLSDCYVNDVSTGIDAKDIIGIKLLSSSKSKISADDDGKIADSKKSQKKRIYSSSSDSSEENERLAEAAVSHRFIIEQSRLTCAEISGLKSEENGSPSDGEGKSTQGEIIHVGQSGDNPSHKDSQRQLPNNHTVDNVKKKKKKKKRHKEEIK